MSQSRKPRVITSEDVDITDRELPADLAHHTAVLRSKSETKNSNKYGRVVSDIELGMPERVSEFSEIANLSPESKQNQIKSPAVFITGSSSDCMCKECSKRVYELEKIIADQAIYHKSCFKCVRCKRLLSLSNYASANGVPFCKPHFMELFKSKGNYEELSAENSAPVVNRRGSSEEINIDADANPDAPKISLPEVKNMKLIFETVPEQQQITKRDSMTSLECLTAKKVSKWDKPERPAPRPVNRPAENDQDSEICESINPPADITKNLVSKFRDLEQGTFVNQSSTVVDRKPVRPFTPPRELEIGITKVSEEGEDEDDYNQYAADILKNEELPPAAITKNLLAKFQSMESLSTSSVPPPPSSSVNLSSSYYPNSSRPRPVSMLDGGTADMPHVDSGIFENEPVSIPADVVRGGTDVSMEVELPEEGMTKMLVAQWRAVETNTSAGTPVRNKSRSPSMTPVVKVRASASGLFSNESGGVVVAPCSGDNMSMGEIQLLEAEKMEAESLPPANITKNLLAMFKTLEVSDDGSTAITGDVTQPKQFKWEVRK